MTNYFYKPVMSIPEFLQLERGKNIRNYTSNIMVKTTEKATILFLAILFNAQKTYAAGKGIDNLGGTLLNLIRGWGYWILLIMCLVETIRAGAGGDSKKILSIIMKYLLVFAAMYLVPSLFNAIKDSF